MTREDFDDIQHRLPFVLTSDEIPEYSILYVGKQKEDELGTYVFDIAPKQIEKNKRYFQGRIWVDDHDFQIVKTYGKNVPDIGVGKHHGEGENLFPKFTTWRQQIDGQYWFPVYTKVDDELHFSSGDVHVKQVVKYTNYKRFGAKSKIIYDGQEISKDQPQQPGTQQPNKTARRRRSSRGSSLFALRHSLFAKGAGLMRYENCAVPEGKRSYLSLSPPLNEALG